MRDGPSCDSHHGSRYRRCRRLEHGIRGQVQRNSLPVGERSVPQHVCSWEALESEEDGAQTEEVGGVPSDTQGQAQNTWVDGSSIVRGVCKYSVFVEDLAVPFLHAWPFGVHPTSNTSGKGWMCMHGGVFQGHRACQAITPGLTMV